jgi:hypothetical protein
MGTTIKEDPIVGQIMLGVSEFILFVLIAIIFIRAWKKWKINSRPKHARLYLILYLSMMFLVLTIFMLWLLFLWSVITSDLPDGVPPGGFWPFVLIALAQSSRLFGLLILIEVIPILILTWRKEFRPQYSLGYFMLMMFAASFCVWGGLRWWQAEQRANEEADNPAHEVTLTKPFYMGKFVVTQEQYQKVIGKNPSHFNGKNNPVEQVSWVDALEFCKRLSENLKVIVCLPTEAEWEYACRAGTSTRYYSGDSEEDLKRVAWSNEKPFISSTHPVGQKEPNRFGLYDMHGNVWQMCQDLRECYEPYSSDPVKDPQGPEHGDGNKNRVMRGGSYWNQPWACCSACRSNFNQDGFQDYIGFRVVVNVPAQKP